MKPIICEHGVLVEPNLHDGYLDGVLVSPDGNVLTLFCREVSGREYRLTVPALVNLRVDEFLEGNIVFGIEVYEGSQCPVEKLQKLWAHWGGEHPRQNMSTHLKEIVDGNWMLIEVSTSYGCELFALSKARADQITVSEGFGPLASPG